MLSCLVIEPQALVLGKRFNGSNLRGSCDSSATDSRLTCSSYTTVQEFQVVSWIYMSNLPYFELEDFMSYFGQVVMLFSHYSMKLCLHLSE